MFYYNRYYLQEERGMYRYDDRIISWPFDSTILVRRFAFDFCDPICQCMPCVRHLRSWETHFLISWAIWWSHSSFDCNFGCNHTGPFLELDEVQEHLFESVIKTKHGFPADLPLTSNQHTVKNLNLFLFRKSPFDAPRCMGVINKCRVSFPKNQPRKSRFGDLVKKETCRQDLKNQKKVYPVWITWIT